MTQKLIINAKELRKKQTDAERFLWKHLRARQIEGIKFRRQQPVGKFIVDFVSYEKKIVLELDGSQHIDAKAEDKERDAWFSEQGFQVLRFWSNEVLENLEGVLEVIRERISPSPNPSHQGRGIVSLQIAHPPLTPPI